MLIDEVARANSKTDDANFFYKVIAARNEAGHSSIITTNIQWDKWGEYLGDDIATAAILDRFVHSYVSTIEGPSRRVKEHSRLNRSKQPQMVGE